MRSFLPQLRRSLEAGRQSHLDRFTGPRWVDDPDVRASRALVKPDLHLRVRPLQLRLNAGPVQQSGKELPRRRRVVPKIAPGRKRPDQYGLTAAGGMLDGRDVPVGIMAHCLSSREFVLLEEIAAPDLLIAHRQRKAVED